MPLLTIIDAVLIAWFGITIVLYFTLRWFGRRLGVPAGQPVSRRVGLSTLFAFCALGTPVHVQWNVPANVVCAAIAAGFLVLSMFHMVRGLAPVLPRRARI